MLNSSAKTRFETQESYLEPLPSSILVWLIGSLCNLLPIPFKQSQLLQQFPPPCSLAALHEASPAFGLTAGVVSITEINWKQLPLPAVAFLKPVGGMSLDVKQSNEDSEPEGCIPILILKRDDKTLLFFREGSKTPETLSVSEAAQYLSANLVLVAKQDGDTSSPEDIDGFEEEKKTFGFKWFVPELLKHKSIWKDVLLASFSIQLVGLATPLFTQVIIDKVIAHQSMSTLYVLAAALIMFMIFTSIMTWLRQYLVLHTGNRIDAVLGSQVFRHLLRLPLPYFEHRPTGTLVARLQGIETIRQFITGAAVTLLLDLPFLVIFLAIMFAYSWQLSLIALAILSVIGLLSFAISPLLRERLNKQFMLGSHNQAFLTEYLSGISTVKSLQMEPNVERKYSNIFAKYLSAGFRAKQVSNTYNVIANTLEQAMTLSILFVSALIVMKNDGFTIGMLVAFQMFASRMSQPMLRLVGLWQEFQQANIAVKRLGDILDMPQEPHSLLPSREGKGTGILELSNLGFRYSENHPWLLS